MYKSSQIYYYQYNELLMKNYKYLRIIYIEIKIKVIKNDIKMPK